MDALKNAKSRQLCMLALIVFFLAIYLGSAYTPALQDDVDSSHAEAAREMLQTGDYITLHVNGVRYLEKAPLMYWLVAYSYSWMGVSDLATRMPTVIAMALLALLGMRWGRQAFGQRAGLYTALFVTTGIGCFLFTRVLIPEAILSVLIALTFYLFITALDTRGSFFSWHGAYAMLAFAVLAKGLLSLVVIGGTMVLYLLVSGEWRRWREFHLGTGFVLFLLIAAPWHIAAAIKNPETATHHGFLWFYFVNEHVMRFLGKRIPHDYNKQPANLYWALHLVWLFPWSLYLPMALWRGVKEWQAKRGQGTILDFTCRTRWICLLWATVTLVFFSFSTNQEYYTFPAYLAIFMLLAASLAGEENDANEHEARGWWLTGTTLLSVTVRVAFAAVLIYGLWNSRHLPFVPDIGEVLAKTNLENDTLSMGHILDLTGQSFAALRLPAMIAVGALLFGSLWELKLRIQREHLASTIALAATMTVFLGAAHLALERFDPYLGSHVLAVEIQRQLKPEDHVMIYGDLSFGSSLLFYLQRPVEMVNGNTTTLWFGSTFPDAPKIFYDDNGLRQLWSSDKRIFLFVPDHEQARVKALLPNLQVYAARSGKVVYVNR